MRRRCETSAYEIIYNLCDNAVKYNNEGGIAEIDISSDEKNAYITVRTAE